MKANSLRNQILIPWLSLPIILTSYLLLWNKIPTQIAIHFSGSGNPVTSVSRTQSLLFSLIALLLLLTIGSLSLWKGKVHPEKILVRYYFAIVAITIIDLAVLVYNT